MKVSQPNQPSENKTHPIAINKNKFYKVPQFYFICLMTLITSAISYIILFEFPKFVDIVSIQIEWIIKNLSIGILVFFTIDVFSNLLCIPQTYERVILGFILSKKINLIFCIAGGSAFLLSANLIAGLLSYALAKLFKKYLRSL